MSDTVYEIAVCKLKPGSNAANARQKAMQAISLYPGFIGWRALTAKDDPDMIADIVEWQSMDDARAAGEMVAKEASFADYMGAIGEVSLMKHFTLDHSA